MRKGRDKRFFKNKNKIFSSSLFAIALVLIFLTNQMYIVNNLTLTNLSIEINSAYSSNPAALVTLVDDSYSNENYPTQGKNYFYRMSMTNEQYYLIWLYTISSVNENLDAYLLF